MLTYVIPITYNHIAVSYIARTYLACEKKRRYRACSPEDELLYHKSMVFNFDKAKGKRVIVVEGLFDALKLIQGSGRYDIVATYGTAVKPEQLAFLREHYEEIIIMFDDEILAQEHARHMVSYLQSYGIKAKSISLKGYEDPGELELEVANKLVNYLLDMQWRD